MIINPGGGAGGGLTAVNLSAGTTSNNLSAVTFDNAGGVSFGLAGSVVTASAPAAAASPINFSAGTTSNNLGSVVFGDGNNVSFGLNGSTITGSIQRGIDQIDAGAGGLAGQVISFGDANGVSFQVSNFSIVGSVQTNYAGVGETVGTVAGTDLGLTVNTDGVSILYPKWLTTAQPVGAYLTTAALSGDTSKYAGVGESVGTVGGTDLGLTVNTDGVSILYPKWLTTAQAPGAYLTTAALSQDSSKYAGINGAITGGSITVNTSGVSVNLPAYLTTAALSGDTTKYAGVGATVGTVAGTDLGLTVNTDGVSIKYPKWLTTAMASDRGSDFVAASAAFAGTNASGTIASNGISVSVAAPGGGATYSNYFEPFAWDENSATSTGSLSQLGVQPFTLPVNLSFGQVNFIGSASVAPTSASNNWSVRLTNSTQGLIYSAGFSVTNSNFVDLFLFTRGSGVFSSELETLTSTRNTFVTYYLATQSARASLTNTAGGNLSLSQLFSMSISYPMITSSTQTSINAGSTYTAWGMGYTTWTSTASNSTSDTISTSVAKAIAAASTYPNTTAWASWKMIPLAFGTSLTPGEYYLGMVRYSSTSSSSNSGSTITGAAGTGATYSVTYAASALTQTAVITWAGQTDTITSSLGWLGFASQATMAPPPGLGTFSGTWASNSTYVNNLGNPNGAIAYSQILTAVSFFRSWAEFASNRI